MNDHNSAPKWRKNSFFFPEKERCDTLYAKEMGVFGLQETVDRIIQRARNHLIGQGCPNAGAGTARFYPVFVI